MHRTGTEGGTQGRLAGSCRTSNRFRIDVWLGCEIHSVSRRNEFLPFNRAPSFAIRMMNIPTAYVPGYEKARKVDGELAETYVSHTTIGDTVMDKVQSDENVVARLLESGKSDREIYDHVFMSAYSRKATVREWDLASNYVASMGSQGVERKQILDDLLWTVINSQEFLVNH